MTKLNSQVENYFLDKNSRIDTQIGSNGEEVFYQEDIRSKSFFWQEDKLAFSIEYPLR